MSFMPKSTVNGLSPPTRGSQDATVIAHSNPGSIPAHAGEPHLPDKTMHPRGVYPRPRGGAKVTEKDHCRIMGLSPPTRGSLGVVNEE